MAEWVESGPNLKTDGVVRWRCADLRDRIAAKFHVYLHERSVGKLLKRLNFSNMSGHPVHPQSDLEAQEALKNVWPAPSASDFVEYAFVQSASYPASGSCPRPRWRSARPGPHKTLGGERHFLNQGSSTPFDCQAISLPPQHRVPAVNKHGIRTPLLG